MKGSRHSFSLLFLLVAAGLGLLCLAPGQAAALTIIPSAWNIVGLDSNTPAFGPYRFSAGARVCGRMSADVLQPLLFTGGRRTFEESEA